MIFSGHKETCWPGRPLREESATPGLHRDQHQPIRLERHADEPAECQDRFLQTKVRHLTLAH